MSWILWLVAVDVEAMWTNAKDTDASNESGD